MSQKILFVISAADHWTLKDGTRHPAGFWAEEVVVPYEYFKAAGHEVFVATPGGVAPTVDPLSLEPDFAGGTDGAAKLRAALAGASELAHPIRIEDVDPDRYAAVLYPGGLAPMEDLSTDPDSARLLVDRLNSGKILGLVCHGPAALLATIDSEGHSPFAGYRLTAMSNAEEATGGLADKAEWLLQDRLVGELGADYREGPIFEPHIETDRNLYTGQNPASAALLAEEMIRVLA